MQFSFYDSTNQTAGTTYIAPGQFYTPCIEFGGTAVVSYSGVTMLVDVPEELLEQANTDGNIDEEQWVNCNSNSCIRKWAVGEAERYQLTEED